jgi:F-type H+-transporting ATPase subunit b
MINGWTFLLEVANFLLLVWLLKHFLYAPIVGVIDRRREHVRAEMDRLSAESAGLDQERRRVDEALRGLAREREEVIHQARAAGEEERGRMIEEARGDAAGLREKARAALAEERRQAFEAAENRVVEVGLTVSERLAQAVAGTTLHRELVKMAVTELAALGPERARALVGGGAPEAEVRVSAGRPLEESEIHAFEEAVQGLLGERARVAFSEDQRLGGGARVEIGELVLDATLAAQIERVRRLAHESLKTATEGRQVAG